MRPIQDWAFDRWRDGEHKLQVREDELLFRAAELEDQQSRQGVQSKVHQSQLRNLLKRQQEVIESERKACAEERVAATAIATRREATLRHQVQE